MFKNYKSLSCVRLLSITFNWEFITNIKLPSMMTVICNVITRTFQSKLKRSYFNKIIRIIMKTIILIIRERKPALQRVDKNWNNYCNNRYFLSGLSLAAVTYGIVTHESSIILFIWRASHFIHWGSALACLYAKFLSRPKNCTMLLIRVGRKSWAHVIWFSWFKSVCDNCRQLTK